MVRRTPAASQRGGPAPSPAVAVAAPAVAPSKTAPPDRARGHPAARLAIVLALVLGAGLAVHALGWERYLTLREFGLRRRALQAFVSGHRVMALELYACAYAVLVALSLPGALLMSLAGGYFFGVSAGAAAAVVGMTAGATAMYLVARTAVGDLVGRALARGRAGGMAARVREVVEADGFVAFLTLRLIPGVPFALVNILAGVVRLPPGRYLVATVLGVTPSTLLYCWIGQDLGRVFRPGGPDLRELIRPQIYAPAGLLALLAVAALALALRRRWAGRRSAARRCGGSA